MAKRAENDEPVGKHDKKYKQEGIRQTFMNDTQAREFIQKISKSGSVYGLDGISGLMERLGNVHEQLAVIHVAGTNGKGSVCAMIAAVLKASGYRTGVYSSPAVFAAEETVSIDGVWISSDEFAQLATKVQAACADMQAEGQPHPTAFEVETAIALCYFAQMNCDYVVLETGLGGALDATNLIRQPVCSVLTSISMDHMAVLGNSLAEIAEAKTGILKAGCPCVSAVQKPEAASVVQAAASGRGCELYVADPACIQDFTYDRNGSSFRLAAEVLESGSDSAGSEDAYGSPHKKLHCPLAGAFQRQNLACAAAVFQVLRRKGVRITYESLSAGLSGVQLHGRFERIGEEPDFYIDGAHNEDAVLLLLETVQKCFTNRRIIYIIGVLADKDYEKALRPILQYAAQIFTVTPQNERALHGGRLAEWAARYHPSVSYVPDPAQAAAAAQVAAGTEGVVLAFGSFSYLGEIRQAVRRDL